MVGKAFHFVHHILEIWHFGNMSLEAEAHNLHMEFVIKRLFTFAIITVNFSLAWKSVVVEKKKRLPFQFDVRTHSHCKQHDQ